MKRLIFLMAACILVVVAFAQEPLLTKCQYWIDDLAQASATSTIASAASTTWESDVDVGDLSEGLHHLHFRFKDNSGNWSVPHTVGFFVLPTSFYTTSYVSHVECWFDDDSSRQTASFSNGKVSFKVPTSGLAEGLHTLNCRLLDNAGRYSATQSWLFVRETLKDTSIATGIASVEYWTDDASGGRNSVAVKDSTVSFTVDASLLPEGLHTVSYRLKDNAGHYGRPETAMFYRLPIFSDTASVASCEYWIDEDIDKKKSSTVSNGIVSVKALGSQLTEGLHTLNCRLLDNAGCYSATQSWLFVREALKDTAIVSEVASVEYWMDNEIAKRKTVAGDDSCVTFVADASSLKEGLHTLNYRIKNSLGNYSPLQTWAFYKSGNQQQASRISWCRYWWNNHTDKAVTDSLRADSAVFVFEKQLVVPEYAKTDGFSRTSTARFSILFGDDLGHTSPLQIFDVSYPDEQPPVTTITATLDDAGTVTTLTWTASEDKITDYNIYYAKENQPFVLWLPNTIKTTATFKGQAGKTYRFTVTARDKAGNREAMDEKKYAKVTFTN